MKRRRGDNVDSRRLSASVSFMFCPQSTHDVHENGLSEDDYAKATKRKRPDREEQPPQNYLRCFLRPSLPLGSWPLIRPTQSIRHRPCVYVSFDAYRPKACTW